MMEEPNENILDMDGDTASITDEKILSATSGMSFNQGSSMLEDDFRMSLDSFSVAENVTVDVGDMSNDSKILTTPVVDLETPTTSTCVDFETPKKALYMKTNPFKKQSSKCDEEIFVKPSPVVTELMSPARMLQYEVDLSKTATPTMKRAPIDFDFFAKENLKKCFADLSEEDPKCEDEATTSEINEYKETSVIVKTDTVRHEIGHGK